MKNEQPMRTPAHLPAASRFEDIDNGNEAPAPRVGPSSFMLHDL
jgi:hypothetical protein